MKKETNPNWFTSVSTRCQFVYNFVLYKLKLYKKIKIFQSLCIQSFNLYYLNKSQKIDAKKMKM